MVKLEMEWNQPILSYSSKLDRYKLGVAERWMSRAAYSLYPSAKRVLLSFGRRNLPEEQRRGRSAYHDSLPQEERAYILRIDLLNSDGDSILRTMATKEPQDYLKLRKVVFDWLTTYFAQPDSTLHLLPIMDASEDIQGGSLSAEFGEHKPSLPSEYLHLLLPKLQGYEIELAGPIKWVGLETEIPDGLDVALQFHRQALCVDLATVAQLETAYEEQGGSIHSVGNAEAKVLDEVLKLLRSLYVQGAIPAEFSPDGFGWNFKETGINAVYALARPAEALEENNNTLFGVTREVLESIREERMAEFRAYCPQNTVSRHYLTEFLQKASGSVPRFEGASAVLRVRSEEQLNAFLSVIAYLRLLRVPQGTRMASHSESSPMLPEHLPAAAQEAELHIAIEDHDFPFVYTYLVDAGDGLLA